MKVLLTTLNSKYIHSNLAIRYLKGYLDGDYDIDILEFTINQNLNKIIGDIYRLDSDVVGFSTYIWNINETLNITKALKMIKPDIKIILGGPEVSFNIKELMMDNPQIDFIVYNEGEETFKELMASLKNKKSFKGIRGLAYQDKGEIYINPQRDLISPLEDIPFPYEDSLNEFKDKIIYYESSRGCPYNCKYCLSSTISGVRYLPIERVKRDISKLIDAQVKQVKFVDRTFNANKKHALEIMKFIIEKNPEDMNFHFEISAHIIDEEILELLSKVKEGLFQFEIGVQSTNDETIDAIGRITDFHKLVYVVEKIKSYKNIHQHLDLIAGLPYEGYNSFKKSFNDVYDMRPEKLQLGFLKLLKGSGLRLDEAKYGYKYLDSPTYEILENNYISFGEIIKLKTIEDLVEKYYNDGFFKHSLEFIIRNFSKDSFTFYEEFSSFWDLNNYGNISHSKNTLYEILMEFYLYKKYDYLQIFTEILKFDFIFNNRKSRLPAGLNREYDSSVQKNIHEILKNEALLNTHLIEYKNIPTKKIVNKVIVEDFNVNILEIISSEYKPISNKEKIYLLFDYVGGKIIKTKYNNITEIVKELI